MTIEKTVDGDCMTLSLEGGLGVPQTPELEQIIKEISDDIKSIVFDCEKLEYISSSGIRQLVAAYKKVNGNCTLTNVNEEVMDVLNMTGISKRITIK